MTFVRREFTGYLKFLKEKNRTEIGDPWYPWNTRIILDDNHLLDDIYKAGPAEPCIHVEVHGKNFITHWADGSIYINPHGFFSPLSQRRLSDHTNCWMWRSNNVWYFATNGGRYTRPEEERLKHVYFFSELPGDLPRSIRDRYGYGEVFVHKNPRRRLRVSNGGDPLLSVHEYRRLKQQLKEQAKQATKRHTTRRRRAAYWVQVARDQFSELFEDAGYVHRSEVEVFAKARIVKNDEVWGGVVAAQADQLMQAEKDTAACTAKLLEYQKRLAVSWQLEDVDERSRIIQFNEETRDDRLREALTAEA